MNELESILNYLETTSFEPHDDYTSEFTYKEQKLLWNYIKYLKEQLEVSEKTRKQAIELIKEKQRKDEFLELNEWQARELLQILNIERSNE